MSRYTQEQDWNIREQAERDIDEMDWEQGIELIRECGGDEWSFDISVIKGHESWENIKGLKLCWGIILEDKKKELIELQIEVIEGEL